MHTLIDSRSRATRNRRRLGAVTLTAAVVIGGGIAVAVPAIAAPTIGETGSLTVTYQRDVGSPADYNPDRTNDGYGGAPLMKSTDVNGVELDPAGHIVTNEHLETSVKGVYASGDVRSGSTMQIATAVGEGATAAMKIREYLDELKRES